MKAHSFVKAKHLDIDETVEEHKLFNSVVECNVYLII